MGQYHMCVNLDKREYLHPHILGSGLKLWEQLANSPGTGAALIILLASHSNGRGGGDLREHPMVGRWRGDRIVFVGDYDDSVTYDVHGQTMTGVEIYTACDSDKLPSPLHFVDVSLEVSEVIEKELDGKFVGTGWRNFNRDKVHPDTEIIKGLRGHGIIDELPAELRRNISLRLEQIDRLEKA